MLTLLGDAFCWLLKEEQGRLDTAILEYVIFQGSSLSPRIVKSRRGACAFARLRSASPVENGTDFEAFWPF